MRFDCDVLIAGGGPTGVTLAVLLAKRAVTVIVAEKEADIYPLPRAAHIDHEGMRILQEAGVADKVMATSRRARDYDFLNAKGALLMRFSGADQIGPGGWPIANMIHQPSVEAALRQSLAGESFASLNSRWQLTSFAQDGDGVTAKIATPDGERTIRARYLVGADGARSLVREASGISFEDLNFEEPWLVVDLLVDDYTKLPTANLQICNPERPTTCVLMGEGRHRWEFMILPGETPEQVSDDAFVEKLLAPWNVKGAVQMERKAIYTFRARIAEQWRKGHVLLAGDAAHQTPPFAGQGMCSGLRDAANLAWKLAQLGHSVRLIPPAYVKPFVKRQKNDAVDAEAICEAAQRPGMRFVAVKTEEQQASGMVFRTRDLLVRQRTQLTNALRGHLTEYGWVAPKGRAQMELLVGLIEEGEMASTLPPAARAMFKVMTHHLEQIDVQIADLDREIARRACEDDSARRLMTIPGIGPVTATAILSLAPPIETFAKGRDFAAWLGLTPLQHSTGGKPRLGSISKMGDRTIRRLLIIGGSSIVRQACRRGAPAGSWLESMLARKPRMLVSVALANKMARIVWALLSKHEDFKAPAAVAA
jgi:2-polyprenyl-6-methoxyphenol hydroxylase-like FAD-dependent oxidoreductase